MNEYVGNSEPDKQYNAELVFFLFFIYVSFIHFFSFKRKHNCDNRQTENKTNTTKNVQKCGGQVAPNSIWLGPSNKTKYFFFSSFTEEQESLLFIFMDIQILHK